MDLVPKMTKTQDCTNSFLLEDGKKSEKLCILIYNRIYKQKINTYPRKNFKEKLFFY